MDRIDELLHRETHDYQGGTVNYTIPLSAYPTESR